MQVEPLVEEWNRSFHLDVRREFRDLSAFDLLECQGCSLQYFVPNSLAGSPDLYAQLEKFAWYYLPHKWEHDVALEDLQGCRRVLEIGCGFGDFVARAQRDEQLEMDGIEQNASAVEQARRRGLPVCLFDLREAAAQFPGKYDAVCSFQVLEHVASPMEFLKAVCALLRPGGKLLLGLPNARSFLRYQFNLLDLPPHHMTRWSERVLGRLPGIFPLRLDRIKREPLAEYHVDAYVEAHCSLLVRYKATQPLCDPRARGVLARLLKCTGVRRLLLGQSLYVSYVRV
ncbi:MAG: class I SAM-dependent methyltransferase [Acidobacteria bacterium]|nr:MAG: class I SAM-dependent methyltransferase [Acidobacteriota bacterium]